MASKSETGHAVNLANFKLLIDRCTAFDAKYAPSNPDISIANMSSLWNLAYTAQTTIRQTEQGAKQPVNAREILFDPLSSRVTQIINLLKSTKASAQVKEDAKGIADIIRGFNTRKPKQTEGETNAETISKSQQGFVQRAEQFSTLVELLKTIPEYTPSEGSLNITELENYYSQLKAANDGLGSTLTSVITARTTRNRALYAADTGIVNVAQNSKDYVKAAFGATSAEYKSVSGIKFRKAPGTDI